MKETKINKEAESRLQTLIDNYKLNPALTKEFKIGNIFYSRLVHIAFTNITTCVLDNIENNKSYSAAVKAFEDSHPGYAVYHAIETNTKEHSMLSLLYVSNNEDNWPGERLYHDYIGTYTINFSHPEFSEFGDIIITSPEDSGALLRIR